MRSFSRSLLLAIAAVVSLAVDTIVFIARRGTDTLIEWLARLGKPAADPMQPRVLLVVARAFVARIVKRQRPVLTAQWRMCPSV